MDVVTHALMGAHAAHLVATTGKALSVRERLLLGGAAAAFPDADFVGFLVDPLRFLDHWHQGPTHSLVLLPIWAALLGALFCAATRRWRALGEAVVVSSIGLATHIALDVITAYGTKVLYPLSDRRVSLGITFVIDPVFTAIVGASLASGLTGRRRLATAGLLLLGLYLGLQGVLKLQALRLAADAVQAGAFATPDRLDAIAQPFSPFNWKLVAVQGSDYRIAHVNLVGHSALVPPWPGLEHFSTLARAYVPPERMQWERRHRFGDEPQTRELAQQLWSRPDFVAFRRFAVYPALSRVDATEAHRCVWFTDLRYDLPVLPETFRYGFCQDLPGAPWRLSRLRYFSADARQRLD